ncbi:P-loop containing nucleoside triphosphate hydrolase [Pseudocohnilembus persalinus]|uniref:p-loop containing nucleoside triphosphate hydrolase n=1 Tax=Pseudocohnilembus persalinus TaxID=266149 RepID=A0A0V0R5W5_PSEPJ|nr:P-loop containing nucleoside triphosphate hydrolase [Pseudocohnilembus persalinus]|eukprot:KRX09894.1 P-loop containing nucleoside triphosphate hydrolase [Pseudocohnilembus persalinus]
MKPYLVPFLHKDKLITKLLLKSYAYLVLSKGFFYGGPLCIKHGINAIQSADYNNAMLIFLAYGTCYSGYVFCDGLRNRKLAEIQQASLHDIIKNTYSHMLKLDPTFFFSQSQRSKLYDIYKAQKSFESCLRTLANFFIPLMADMVLSTAFLLYYCGFEFFIAFAVTFGAYGYFTLDLSFRRLQGMRNQKRLERKQDFVMGETLSNFFNVKYYNAEKYENERFQKILDDYTAQVIVNQKTLAQLNSGQRIVFSLGITFNLIYGTMKASKGILTAGDLVLMQQLMMQIMQPLFFLGVFYREFQDSSLDIQRLYNIMDEKPSIIEDENAQDFDFKGGHIIFQNVSFGYQKNKKIYNNFNLEIPSNSWISIVGESGIGKSTLCNLIFRLFNIEEGEIYIDGQNVKKLKLHSFRSKIGVISQTPYMFNDTVMNNLLYANQSKTREDVIEICKKLHLHEVIMNLPKGYDSLVGEQGGKFSGGEKQRISIARCLLREPQILIMDEPTSSLDSSNEYNVMDIIEEYRKQKDMVIIMITHRLNLNVYADRIIYLGKHNYQESGTHLELLQNQNSRYSSMWQDFIQEEKENPEIDPLLQEKLEEAEKQIKK